MSDVSLTLITGEKIPLTNSNVESDTPNDVILKIQVAMAQKDPR